MLGIYQTNRNAHPTLSTKQTVCQRFLVYLEGKNCAWRSKILKFSMATTEADLMPQKWRQASFWARRRSRRELPSASSQQLAGAKKPQALLAQSPQLAAHAFKAPPHTTFRPPQTPPGTWTRREPLPEEVPALPVQGDKSLSRPAAILRSHLESVTSEVGGVGMLGHGEGGKGKGCLGVGGV